MIAKTYDVQDGPDESGEMFERPGRPTDRLPMPYPNEETARFANNGALPPDLSVMVKARPRLEDYVFHLLTGYRDSPAGVGVRTGLYYNPYFSGGLIGMAPPLADGQIEYDDGTDNSLPQLAKDVTTFLAWTAEPEHDHRKRMAAKYVTAMLALACVAGYWKRIRWSVHKSRKISWIK